MLLDTGSYGHASSWVDILFIRWNWSPPSPIAVLQLRKIILIRIKIIPFSFFINDPIFYTGINPTPERKYLIMSIIKLIFGNEHLTIIVIIHIVIIRIKLNKNGISNLSLFISSWWKIVIVSFWTGILKLWWKRSIYIISMLNVRVFGRGNILI